MGVLLCIELFDYSSVVCYYRRYMLKIRLQRIGRKNAPAFRLVVTDSKNAAQSGKFLEILGTHTVKSDSVSFDGDRVKHWIKNGAQVSPSAHNMLVKQGIIEGKKKNVLSKKSPTVKRKELKKK